MTVAADCRPSPCASQSSTASRTVYPVTPAVQPSAGSRKRSRNLLLASVPRATGAFRTTPCHGRRSQSWSSHPPRRCSSQCSPPSPRARRVTSDDPGVDVLGQRRHGTTSGGPASPSVADPTESAHRGRTDSAQRLRRLVHVIQHGRHRGPALSDSHDCSSLPGATTGLPSVRTV